MDRAPVQEKLSQSQQVGQGPGVGRGCLNIFHSQDREGYDGFGCAGPFRGQLRLGRLHQMGGLTGCYKGQEEVVFEGLKELTVQRKQDQ